MEQRLSLITLGVADLGRARRFYEALGWTASPASQDSVTFFQAGGMVVALWHRDALAADAGLAPAPAAGFSGVALAYNTRSRDEVAEVLDAAITAGATLRKPAADTFWGGHSGYFSDPDGHLWEVAWNPFWRVMPDGEVMIGLG